MLVWDGCFVIEIGKQLWPGANQEKRIDEDVEKSSHRESAGIGIQPEGQLAEHAQRKSAKRLGTVTLSLLFRAEPCCCGGSVANFNQMGARTRDGIADAENAGDWVKAAAGTAKKCEESLESAVPAWER